MKELGCSWFEAMILRDVFDDLDDLDIHDGMTKRAFASAKMAKRSSDRIQQKEAANALLSLKKDGKTKEATSGNRTPRKPKQPRVQPAGQDKQETGSAKKGSKTVRPRQTRKKTERRPSPDKTKAARKQ